MMGIRTRNTWKNDSTSIRWRFFSNCRRVGVDILLSLLQWRFHAVNQRKTPMAGRRIGVPNGFLSNGVWKDTYPLASPIDGATYDRRRTRNSPLGMASKANVAVEHSVCIRVMVFSHEFEGARL